MDFPGSRDCRDKWRRELAAHPLHPAQCLFESGRHVVTGHITGGEYEFTHPILFKGALFKKVVADSLIGGEQDPTIPSYKWKPGFIGCAARKMSEVALKAGSDLRKSCHDSGGITEIFVQI